MRIEPNDPFSRRFIMIYISHKIQRSSRDSKIDRPASTQRWMGQIRVRTVSSWERPTDCILNNTLIAATTTITYLLTSTALHSNRHGRQATIPPSINNQPTQHPDHHHQPPLPGWLPSLVHETDTTAAAHQQHQIVSHKFLLLHKFQFYPQSLCICIVLVS